MNKRDFLATGTAFGLAAAHVSVAATSKSVTLTRSQNALLSEIAEVVLKTAYTRAGYEFSVRALPGRRSLKESREGKSAGEVLRIAALAGRFPTLKMINPPIAKLQSSAFALKGSGVTVSGPADLANYSVVYVNGIAHTENNAKNAKSSHGVNNAASMMEMLSAGRMDLALYSAIPARAILASGDYPDVDPTPMVLTEHPLHHFVHEAYPDVAQDITKVLEEMDQNGELAALYEQTANDMIAQM